MSAICTKIKEKLKIPKLGHGDGAYMENTTPGYSVSYGAFASTTLESSFPLLCYNPQGAETGGCMCKGPASQEGHILGGKWT